MKPTTNVVTKTGDTTFQVVTTLAPTTTPMTLDQALKTQATLKAQLDIVNDIVTQAQAAGVMTQAQKVASLQNPAPVTEPPIVTPQS